MLNKFLAKLSKPKLSSDMNFFAFYEKVSVISYFEESQTFLCTQNSDKKVGQQMYTEILKFMQIPASVSYLH